MKTLPLEEAAEIICEEAGFSPRCDPMTAARTNIALKKLENNVRPLTQRERDGMAMHLTRRGYDRNMQHTLLNMDYSEISLFEAHTHRLQEESDGPLQHLPERAFYNVAINNTYEDIQAINGAIESIAERIKRVPHGRSR